MKNDRDFLGLSVRDFTFVILGRDTQHFINDVDRRFDFTGFGYKEIAKYLKCGSNDWDEDILKAIKEDMACAFDEFIFLNTSVAIPDELRSGVRVRDTVPPCVVWTNEKGKRCDMYYDGMEIYCDDEMFDCIPMIDAHRETIGLPPLKTLEFKDFERAFALEKHDLFRRLQRNHFECHTLYAYAMKLVNRHLGLQSTGDEDSPTPQPDQSSQSDVANTTEPVRNIPVEVNNPTAQAIFEDLAVYGLMKIEVGGYKWLGTKKEMVLCAEEMGAALNFWGKRWKVFQDLFGVKRLAQCKQRVSIDGRYCDVRREMEIKAIIRRNTNS